MYSDRSYEEWSCSCLSFCSLESTLDHPWLRWTTRLTTTPSGWGLTHLSTMWLSIINQITYCKHLSHDNNKTFGCSTSILWILMDYPWIISISKSPPWHESIRHSPPNASRWHSRRCVRCVEVRAEGGQRIPPSCARPRHSPRDAGNALRCTGFVEKNWGYLGQTWWNVGKIDRKWWMIGNDNWLNKS